MNKLIKSQLLRIALILGAVLFCIIALLQLPSTSSLSASSSQAKEEPPNRAEATATLVSFPIKHIITTSFTGVNDIDVADLDGDEKLDIIGGSLDEKGFTWWKNEDGKDSDWIKHTVDEDGDFSGTRSLQAADIDNDNDYDVVGVVVAAADGAIVWWENDGNPMNGGWTQHTVEEEFNNAWDVYVAKMDTDNDMDLLGIRKDAEPDNISIMLWENSQGDGVEWETHIIATTNEFKTSRPSIYAADMDNDTNLDVLAASSQDGIRWWENNGTLPNATPWPTQIVINNKYKTVTSIYPAQMNQTGNPIDIISIYEAGDDYIGWWENPGPREPNLVAQFDGGQDVYAADLDQDGDMDILGVGTEGVAWWENQGTNWPRHDVDSSFSEAKVVMVADLNGDGYPDILAAGGNTIAWWQFVPDAPVLTPIKNADKHGNYIVSWSTDQDVSTYTLEEDDEPTFSSATPYTITEKQKSISGQKSGTYYYHVRAENEIGHSPWSDFVSVTVPYPLYIPVLRKDPTPTPTPTPTNPPTPTPTNPPTPTPTYTPCLTTEDEQSYPNNQRADAVNNPSVCENVSLTGTLPDGDPQDYYKIEVSNSGTLKVDLDHIPQGTDYDLYLYDSNGNQIAESNNEDTKPEHIDVTVTPETYYLRVYPYLGRSNEEYILKWEVVSP